MIRERIYADPSLQNIFRGFSGPYMINTLLATRRVIKTGALSYKVKVGKGGKNIHKVRDIGIEIDLHQVKIYVRVNKNRYLVESKIIKQDGQAIKKDGIVGIGEAV